MSYKPDHHHMTEIILLYCINTSINSGRSVKHSSALSSSPWLRVLACSVQCKAEVYLFFCKPQYHLNKIIVQNDTKVGRIHI